MEMPTKVPGLCAPAYGANNDGRSRRQERSTRCTFESGPDDLTDLGMAVCRTH